MVRSYVNFALLLPVLACLLAGGCQWARMAQAPVDTGFDRPAEAGAVPPSLREDVRQAPLLAAQTARGTDQSGRAASRTTGRPYTLEECRAITLNSNPDIQAEFWEESARGSLASAARARMLPHPSLVGEFSNRNNHRWPYDSTDDMHWYDVLWRSTWRYFLEIKWSPTDALTSYYLSQNQCNDSVKARYHRVRLIQKLLAGVDAAYFRLLGLQQCLPLAERLSRIRTNVARETYELRQGRLADLDEYHRTEERASAARFRLSKMRVELERQKIILSSLMGLPPKSCPEGQFFVTGALSVPHYPQNPCDLEVQALKSRPEACIEGLNQLNSFNEVRRTQLKYFPKATGFLRYGQDNAYKRQDWNINDAGLYVSLDLLDWFTNFKETSAAKANDLKTQQRMAAVALAVASEVRVSALRCLESTEELLSLEASIERAQKHLNVAKGRAKAGMLEKVAVEDAEGNLLQEQMERIHALGEANARVAELQCATGTNYGDGASCP
ncbi:MAG: TolC family protein [Desulfomonile tiedjei]|nr:TolC family protein [Desulfomonile tiedjei]